MHRGRKGNLALGITKARPRRRGEAGFTLIEQLIALALVAIVLTGLIQALGLTIVGAQRSADRGTLLHLALSQLESIKSQTYQPTPSNYTLISAPQDFTISVAGAEAATYQYNSPDVTAAPSTVQLITVTVTSLQDTIEVVGYRVRR